MYYKIFVTVCELKFSLHYHKQNWKKRRKNEVVKLFRTFAVLVTVECAQKRLYYGPTVPALFHISIRFSQKILQQT